MIYINSMFTWKDWESYRHILQLKRKKFLKKRREEEKEGGRVGGEKEGRNFNHLLFILILFLKSTFQFNFIPFFWNSIIYVHILPKFYIILLLQNNTEGFLLLCLFWKKKNLIIIRFIMVKTGSRISYFPIFLVALPGFIKIIWKD